MIRRLICMIVLVPLFLITFPFDVLYYIIKNSTKQPMFNIIVKSDMAKALNEWSK